MPSRIFLQFRSSMSAKTALIVILPVAIVTFVFSYYHYIHERDSIFENAKTQLLRVGENLKGPAESHLQKSDYPGLQKVVQEASLEADIEQILLFDSQGNVKSGSKEQLSGKKITELSPSALSERDVKAIWKSIAGGYSVYYDPHDLLYCLVMPLSIRENDAGAMLISLDTKSSQAEIRERLMDNVLLSIAVIVLSGSVIYLLFYYLFTKRIKAMSAAALKLASGDLSARAEQKGTDEIGYLASSLNLLAEDINNRKNNMEEMVQHRMNELLVLFDVVNTVSQSLELGTVLPAVLKRVLDNFKADRGAVVLVESDGTTLKPMCQQGLSEEAVYKITKAGQGCVGDVILRNKAMRISGSEEGESACVMLEHDDVLSALVVPISARGHILGALAVYSRGREKFSDEDEALMVTIGNQLSVAVLNARLYEQTLQLAQMDALTGLANRRYLMERLGQEITQVERYHTSLSAIMMDLDKFKSFNDTYGHLKGDELLRSFSSMIKNAIRSVDIAGRYGGEEFCIVLPNTSITGAVVVAERIRAGMEALLVPLNDQPPAGRTVSIGVAEFISGETIEKLLSDADTALYQAKETGRNRVVTFSSVPSRLNNNLN